MERRDLTAQEEEIYLHVLAHGPCPAAEVNQNGDGEAALQQLLALGLLAVDPEHPDDVAAVDPALAAARITSQVLEESSRNLAWIARLPQATASLSRRYRTAQESQSGVIEVVTGIQAIGQRLEMLLESCNKRMLTMHPEGSRPSATLEAVLGRDLDVIGRAADVRFMYLSPVRRLVAVQRYVEAVTAAGAAVRTLPELPLRTFVIDDTALIPYQGDTQSAVFIQDPSTVALLVETFDLLWRLGEEFVGGPRNIDEEQIEETLRAVMRLLVDGNGTRQIARKLGISERQVTRFRADISEHYGTDSAVRLGWLLAREHPNGI